jgi:hypothetical protein
VSLKRKSGQTSLYHHSSSPSIDEYALPEDCYTFGPRYLGNPYYRDRLKMYNKNGKPENLYSPSKLSYGLDEKMFLE